MTTHKITFADARIAHTKAKAQGLKKYHGAPCKRYGHTERYVSTSACVACHIEKNRRIYAKNSEAMREQQRTYYAKNSEAIREQKRTYYEENTETMRERGRTFYEENSEAIIKQKLEYARENPDKINAKNARRRAAKAQATPPWSLYGYHKDRIDSFYADSALFKWAFGLPFEVDHIISLLGPLGGLHVWWNLQHLIQSTNASKGTKDDSFVYPEMTFDKITYRYNKGRVAL